MKKNTIAVLSLLVTMSSVVQAQTTSTVVPVQPEAVTVTPIAPSPVPHYAVPDKIPLQSEATLKAYALTLVGKIDVQVGGSSVSGNAFVSVDYTNTDADPDKMAAVASSQTLQFSTTTDDKLHGYVNYKSRMITIPGGNFSEKGGASDSQQTFNLFYGGTDFQLEKVNGVWKVPEKAYAVELEFSHVPFVVTGVSDAYIITKNESGYITGWYSFRQAQGNYWLDRGLIFLTKEQTSHAGEFHLVMKDGTQTVYDLASGDQKPTAAIVAGGFKPMIKGVRTVSNDTTNIVFQSGDEIIRTRYTKVLNSQVSFPPGLDRYPIKVGIVYTRVLAEDPNTDWFEFDPWAGPVQFKIQSGQSILIRFEYPPNSQPLNNPNSGDGPG